MVFVHAFCFRSPFCISWCGTWEARRVFDPTGACGTYAQSCLAQAVIYVVDSGDVDRISTAKQEFHVPALAWCSPYLVCVPSAILEEEELKDALILVFANKQVPMHNCCLHSSSGGIVNAGFAWSTGRCGSYRGARTAHVRSVSF
eukprot:2352207-Pyramimonas_sp.AAC.4